MENQSEQKPNRKMRRKSNMKHIRLMKAIKHMHKMGRLYIEPENKDGLDKEGGDHLT